MNGDKLSVVPAGCLVAVTVAVVWALLAALPAWLLWNWLMPDIFGLPRITFVQAGGLIFLAHCIIPRGQSGSSDK